MLLNRSEVCAHFDSLMPLKTAAFLLLQGRPSSSRAWRAGAVPVCSQSSALAGTRMGAVCSVPEPLPRALWLASCWGSCRPGPAACAMDGHCVFCVFFLLADLFGTMSFLFLKSCPNNQNKPCLPVEVLVPSVSSLIQKMLLHL